MTNDDKKPISVLLIDDDEDDYLIIKHVFSRIPETPFVLSWCSSYDEAKKQILRGEADIYLIDYRLGAQSGLDLLKLAEPAKRSEPFIILTGVGDREIEKRAMRLAAADYLVKGTFDVELLSRTLFYSLGRKQIEQQQLDHLRELSRTKDEFISLASHQLRTPATAVKQFIGMVIEGLAGDVSDTQLQLLQKAYDSNERQLRIVSDLLKVAQVDAGKVTLRKTDTDLGGVIRDVAKELEGTYAGRHQGLRLHLPQEGASALIDKDRIRMVIENLLDNASKYSPAQTSVDVTLETQNGMLLVTIADQGVGIAKADQGRLFEKFSRIHNSLSTQVGGTGLGLYWAHKIVDLHGGRIDVRSREGKGTTFIIRLPKLLEPTMLKTEEASARKES